MSKTIQRSIDDGITWENIAVLPDDSSSYFDTGSLDPTGSYVYRVLSISQSAYRYSVEKYMPWQLFTGSIYSVSQKYIDSSVLNQSGIYIYTSASYTASYTGSMSGWVEGIPSESLNQYKIRFGVVTDVNYLQETSSLYNALLANSKSYDLGWSRSIVGSVSEFPGIRSEYYVVAQSEGGFLNNGTSSLCVADIVFDGTDYSLPYSDLVSGSVQNLASGSYSDYWVYVYRYLEGDILYATETPTSCSIDASGNWSQSSVFAGHANYPIWVKMRRKTNTSSPDISAVAGLYPNGEYFNAGVDGYYVTTYGAIGGTDVFPNDEVFLELTHSKCRLVRKSDNRIMGVSSNPIPYTGSWEFTDTGTSPKVFRLYSGSAPMVQAGEYDTGSYIVEKAANSGSGLLNSYWTPLGGVLNNRCFTYDQAVAIIAMISVGDEPTAKTLVQGILTTLTGSNSGSWTTEGTFAMTGSQWAFSVNALDGKYVDPYYRNGAQFWVAEGISFYKEKFPTSSIANQITSSLKSFWQTMFQYYWVGPSGSGIWPITASAAQYVAFSGGDSGYIQNTQSYSGSGLQLNTFLGGAGVYGPAPAYYFTASYIIPWASCEHNTDAWFALRSSARAIGGTWSSSLAASASLLGYALVNNFWYASGSQLRQQNANSQSRAYQGIGNPYLPDDAHALDVSSWYGMALYAMGEYGKFSASMAVLPQYYLQDPGGSTAYGYTPYLELYEYPGNTPTLWPEGTAGVILAYRLAGSHSFAKSIHDTLPAIFTSSFGFPYATVADPAYELGNSGSITANTWLMIASNPKGFWEVDF